MTAIDKVFIGDTVRPFDVNSCVVFFPKRCVAAWQVFANIRYLKLRSSDPARTGTPLWCQHIMKLKTWSIISYTVWFIRLNNNEKYPLGKNCWKRRIFLNGSVLARFNSMIFLKNDSSSLLRKENRPQDLSFGGNNVIYFYLWHGHFELFAWISAPLTSWS